MPAQEKSGLGDYIWLAYSVFFFFEPLARNNRLYWGKCATLYVIFLAVYISFIETRRQSLRYTLLALMALVGYVGLTFNGGAACFFTFAAAFLPFTIESTAVIFAFLAAEVLAVVLEGWLLHLDRISVFISILLIGVVGTSNILIGQKRRAHARLSLAHDEIERLAALAERERIARDMHDVLGHTLSVIVLKAELARRLLESHAAPEQIAPMAAQPSLAPAALHQAANEIAELESTARSALAEVRSAIVGYRSAGLGAELDLARRTLRAAGVDLNLDSSLDPAALHLSATEETVLSLAMREAVTNIVRHASATSCLMRLGVTADGFHSLLVEDDGRSAAEPPHEGNGLRGMRERVQGLGGRFRIGIGGVALPGTALVIELPATNLQRAKP